MTEERFRKFLAFRSPNLLGGADTRKLADDLAREWDGAVYMHVDLVADLQSQLEQVMKERDMLSLALKKEIERPLK